VGALARKWRRRFGTGGLPNGKRHGGCLSWRRIRQLAITAYLRGRLLSWFGKLAAVSGANTMALSRASASITEIGIRRTSRRRILKCYAIGAICRNIQSTARRDGIVITRSDAYAPAISLLLRAFGAVACTVAIESLATARIRRPDVEPERSVVPKNAPHFTEHRHHLLDILGWRLFQSELSRDAVVTKSEIRRRCNAALD